MVNSGDRLQNLMKGCPVLCYDKYWLLTDIGAILGDISACHGRKMISERTKGKDLGPA